MVEIYVLREIDPNDPEAKGKMYIFNGTEVKEYNGEPLGNVNTIIEDLKETMKELEKIRDDLNYEKTEILKALQHRTTEKTYVTAEKLGAKTRHDAIKELTREIRALIDVLNEKFGVFNVFTHEEKMILIRNLADVVKSLGYDFEIEEITEEGYVRITVMKERDRRTYMFTQAHLEDISADPFLRELLSPVSIIPYMSKDRKEMILNSLERFRIA